MATEVLPDAQTLRAGRRERALAEMDKHGLDILVLGRQANIRYVTGAPQLWIAGTRPFGPMCVLVRATGDIYLNSTDDEGVPEEIDHDHLYGLAWNPITLIDVLKKVDGAETARRVGTDAITPTFAALLPEAFPNAADAGRGHDGGDGRGRGQHAGHPGRRLGDVAGTAVASWSRRGRAW
jgi:hypothetical protein